MAKREINQEKIISATIECIEKYGIADTTTRNISELAGVNISAISYYFQGRDNLINIAFEKTMQNAFDLNDIDINKEDNYKIVLYKVLNDWLKGAIAYPNISRAHIDGVINSKPQGEIMLDKISDFLDTIYSLLVSRGMLDDKEHKLKLKMIYSSLFGHIMLSDFENDATSNEEFLNLLVSSI